MTAAPPTSVPPDAAGSPGSRGQLPVLRQGTLVSATLALWHREMVRFLRQRNRVIGSLATPVVFWLLLGSGLNRTVQLPGMAGGEGYMAYFYPGTVMLVLMFTAIFSTFSVIEDRREGFLQGVLAAPSPRLAIVLGKVVGGATLAVGQGVVLLALWPLVAGWPGAQALAVGVLVMFLVAMALTALGLCLAWPCDSTAGFHAIMNLLLMPMWFLSGAVFPFDSAPVWMRAVMAVNPLTYAQAALSASLRGHPLLEPVISAPWRLCPLALDGITLGFMAVMIALACRVVLAEKGGATA